jgi:PAS domain S-box-containing protein
LATHKPVLLLVDDHEQLLRLCSRILEADYDIEVARSAAEAHAAARARPPEILVCDLTLPDGSGVDVASQLAAQFPDLCILIITGGLPDEVERARLPTGAALLLKPFAPAELMRAVRELTERTNSSRQEQVDAMQAMEHRYRLLVERATDIIYETDANGFFTYANPVASDVVGRPLEELLGLRFTQLIREDVRRDADKFYFLQASNRIPTTYYEFPMITAKGSEVWIGQNVQLLMHGSAIIGFQAVARDITEKRNIERFKDELLAVVSHELRTPLTTITGALGLLKTGKVPPEKADRLLTVALSDAERMRRLLQDFLDLEQMRSAQFQMAREQVGISDLLSDAAEAAHLLAETAGVPLVVEPIEGSVYVDRDRMLQALVNLLANAIKFSEQGAPVVLTASENGKETGLIVRDRGRGIPADKADLIYEPFRQVDQGDARAKGGTGIGLAITQTIVQRHGGRIELQSEVGRGSTFTICLPHASPV